MRATIRRLTRYSRFFKFGRLSNKLAYFAGILTRYFYSQLSEETRETLATIFSPKRGILLTKKVFFTVLDELFKLAIQHEETLKKEFSGILYALCVYVARGITLVKLPSELMKRETGYFITGYFEGPEDFVGFLLSLEAKIYRKKKEKTNKGGVV